MVVSCSEQSRVVPPGIPVIPVQVGVAAIDMVFG